MATVLLSSNVRYGLMENSVMKEKKQEETKEKEEGGGRDGLS